MIISIDTEKYFDTIQHQFMIKTTTTTTTKTLQRVDLNDAYFNITKTIHDKPTATANTGEKLTLVKS